MTHYDKQNLEFVIQSWLDYNIYSFVHEALHRSTDCQGTGKRFGIMKAPETNVRRPKALDIKRKTRIVTVLWSSASLQKGEIKASTCPQL